jgi:hypothetical protein
VSIHRKPSNADGHSEGQTRTARETIPWEKRRPTAPNAASSGVKSEAEDKIPGENGGEQCSARQAMQKNIRLSHELYLLWS